MYSIALTQTHADLERERTEGIALVIGLIVALGGLIILLGAQLGVNPLSQWQFGSTVLGAVAIAAGIAAIVYFAHHAYHTGRMIEIYEKVSREQEKGHASNQNELIEYLIIKIQDGKMDALKDTFSKLDLASQGILCSIAAKEGRLLELVDAVPKNVKQIELSLGNQPNFDKACNLVDQFKLKLNSFTQLDYLVLDLSGVAYYTDSVHNHTEQMLKAIYQWGDVSFGTYGYDSIDRGFIEPNNAAAANRAVDGLLKYMKNNPITAADIIFKDHTVTISKVNSSEGPRLMITKVIGERMNIRRVSQGWLFDF